MTSLCKHVTSRFSLFASAVLLLVLLTACSGLGSVLTSPTPTPTPKPVMVTYSGDGYTISYPKDWKKSVETGDTSFQDSLGENALGVVVVANPNGIAPLSTVIDASLTSATKEANATKTSPAKLPASVSLSGETWMQKGTIGTVSESGVDVQFEVVVFATNHPASSPNTRIFEFVYTGPYAVSELLDAQIFQAMIASFKFTS